jgi:predicted HTH transcriptional regulator
VPIINLEALVETLVALPAETEWVEFKHNRFDPQEVGEYVSALANGAILTDQRSAYLVFGIEDGSHQVVGTTADPMKHKVGGEAFINWLARGLDPRLNIEVGEGRCRDQRVVVLVIDPAYARPVRFMGVEYIRNGPHKRRLADFPEKERALWLATTRFSFEQADAARHIAPSDVVSSLHLDVFFNLLQEPKPGSESSIIDRLIREGLIRDDLQGGYDISNLAALTLAKDLGAFPGLRRKVLRIVRYRGTDKLETLEERTPTEGYAASFQAILRTVLAAVPAHEAIIDGVRRNVPMVPEIALREVIANALIHQDLTTGGAGPLIEIYADRVEVTNPGEPLVEPDRFLDAPPRSRNEALASLMRRLRIP